MRKPELLSGQKQKGESSKAVQACNDWLRMGPGRSLADLWRQYRDTQENTTPTRSLNTLEAWSSRYVWAERAEEYDARIEDDKNARIQEIMGTGLALVHERVHTLKDLGKLLLEQLYERGEEDELHNLWLPDVKQIGGGEYAERVDIERYNSPLVGDIRGVLDDLARETGGRVHKQELSGADGAPVNVVLYMPDNQREGEQVEDGDGDC